MSQKYTVLKCDTKNESESEIGTETDLIQLHMPTQPRDIYSTTPLIVYRTLPQRFLKTAHSAVLLFLRTS